MILSTPLSLANFASVVEFVIKKNFKKSSGLKLWPPRFIGDETKFNDASLAQTNLILIPDG
jgi:hypothetical protein